MRIKKISILALAAIIVMTGTLTGCKSKWKNPMPEDTILVIKENETQSKTQEEEQEHIEIEEKDFADHATLADAVEKSGIALALPGEIKGYREALYSNYKDVFIEVIYKSEEVDEFGVPKNTIILRKEPSENPTDVSGDDTAYSLKTSSEFSKTTVTVKGEPNGAYVALWWYGGASYALVSRNAVELQSFNAMISDIIEVNR